MPSPISWAHGSMVDYCESMRMETNMEDCDLILLISAIACSIIKCCPDDEVTILAAAFTQLGDTLATYLTQKDLRESKSKDKV